MILRTALAAGGSLSALSAYRRFILYRLVWIPERGKWNKIPCSWHTGEIANAHDESIQIDWQTAVTTAEVFGEQYGVGFVFNAADGFWFLDIDKCLVDGQWSALSQMLVAAFPGAAVEVSVSGTGLHIFGRGTIPPHSSKNIPLGLEFYHEGRFVALTGTNAVGDAGTDHTAALKWLVDNYFPLAVSEEMPWTDLGVPVEQDELLLNKMITSTSAGSVFGNRASFADLWFAKSDKLALCYPDSSNRAYDASSADMALCQHLAFWTKKDCARMWRLIWQSALRRDKWDDRPEYVRDTILAACSRQTEVYKGDERAVPVTAAGAATGPDDDRIIPVSNHLCTDQRNAQRLALNFGGRIMFSEGEWYGWDGMRWLKSKKESWLSAQQLSTLVKAEALEWRAKAEAKRAAGDPENGFEEDECANSLAKHAIKCESKATKDAALGELANLCGVDIEKLDANPWEINTLSGIVDLRDGSLKPHDPAARMTKLCPVKYVPDAKCPKFEAFLKQIMGGNYNLTSFLQRWFGYCATGSVREQKFAIHHGDGSNGKGTLMGAIQDVFGTDYAGEVPTGMLTAGKSDNRHPTEIADLRGRRMATSSEGKEDETLREDLIKRATGGDRLKGRFMRQDFFEFTPTHKLQLFTNHRPRILGTDYAIWRRVMLIPYLVKFGTQEELDKGIVHFLKDPKMVEGGFKSEREGIFAWIVRGAVDWYQNGLRPPQEVIASTLGYKNEQDGMGQFISEQCEVGVDYTVPLNGEGFSECLYPRYVDYCKMNGVFPMGARRFLNEIRRAVLGCYTTEATRKSPITDRTVKLQIVHGIR